MSDLLVPGGDGFYQLSIRSANESQRLPLAGTTPSFVKGTAETTWLIVHNLSAYPNVTVTDSSGNKIAETAYTVKYDSENQITLTFGSAQAGTAYLN